MHTVLLCTLHHVSRYPVLYEQFALAWCSTAAVYTAGGRGGAGPLAAVKLTPDPGTLHTQTESEIGQCETMEVTPGHTPHLTLHHTTHHISHYTTHHTTHHISHYTTPHSTPFTNHTAFHIKGY